MSGETYVTIIGRLTKDPDLKFLGNSAVAEFGVAVNARKFNKQTNEWEKKPTKFWDCGAWNAGKQTLADNVVEVLRKGDSVVVYGELETRTWEDRDGNKRSADQLRVISIGKDLTWHQGNSPHQATGGGYGQSQPSPDSWGSADAGGWGSPSTSEDPVF
ncbi:single-stranded DNA-binding protein [Arthrobacter sp. zg-Y859]|uniref:Single-stranded DNA-binding protein n=1 Tax=Arthrobacter jinronghuae TaxID=2964609 RepID=A0ABT1NV41_9MICC|nr:single-stranded DNA-binding protein [Arthrobacter jinronghuae]MCQ1951590.1 single-stranded DNA-binding protein [Arthrobacter jinronghuae]UWX79695.1 single-stranded DNA-binding protein [Arthrobacter jinronghuae]